LINYQLSIINYQLYIVPTPIGNLGDITFRAIKVLKEVDLILAEDTRKTKILLNRYQIDKPLLSHHQFNEHKTTPKIVARLQSGESIALVSNAGTPGISDPGFYLIRACLAENIEIECLPGATAFIPALVNSGLPTDKFCFEGFLPHKKGRKKRLSQLANEKRTMIFYESPHRLIKTLEQFIASFGADRQAAVCRELTKIHEQTLRGTLSEIKAHFTNKNIKGEIVIIVSG